MWNTLFYEGYWNSLYDTTSAGREEFESWAKAEFGKYQALFSYFNKNAAAGLSYSITCNGRGFGNAQAFNAIVPFAAEKNKYHAAFYQILHEYTHQFTDEIVGSNIKMDDGTHDLSERAVILFDYYLIKQLSPADADLYLKWAGETGNISNCTEQLFLSAFEVEDNINKKLLKLADEISAG